MGMTEPVLVMAFNRPDHLETLIGRLREVRPTRLYLAVDGARPDREGEAERVQACQDLASTIDWPCDLLTLFQEQNLGCGLGVTTAITWFFDHEERGIILEDDVIPDPSFFGFCAELLDRYEDDDRVFAVSGANLVPPAGLTHPDDAYRFTQVPHIWGWATWRRSWAQHRLDISDWRRRLSIRRLWSRVGHSLPGTFFWASTFEVLGRKQVDTWDGQLVLAAMASGQLTAISNVCLTENIGFGSDATHTVELMDDLLPVTPIVLPTRPVAVRVDARADAWTRRHHFGATFVGVSRLAVKYVQRMRKGNAL
jgi:hypothetical protein